jgi:hypothetical protein
MLNSSKNPKNQHPTFIHFFELPKIEQRTPIQAKLALLTQNSIIISAKRA